VSCVKCVLVGLRLDWMRLEKRIHATFVHKTAEIKALTLSPTQFMFCS
jgi:hypothetical protein